MPRKIRQLIRDLERAGFVNLGGKGSHRKYKHPQSSDGVTVSGNPGDDAKSYQEKAVKKALEQAEHD